MSTQPKHFVTPEEYLELERKAASRSEYFHGAIYAMAGGSLEHAVLTANMTALIGGQLRGGRCRAMSSDLRVCVSATGLYTYPDLTVVCGKPELLPGGSDTLLNPTVIVEVHSPSTEGYDRGDKFAHYKTIPSLQQYVLVAQHRIQIDVLTRQNDGWLLTTASQTDQTVRLESIACELAVLDVYEGVELPSPGLSHKQSSAQS